MALTASRVSSCPAVTNTKNIPNSYGILNSYAKSMQRNNVHCRSQGVELRQLNYGRLLKEKMIFSNDGSWRILGKPVSVAVSQRSTVLYLSRGTHNTKAKEPVITYDDPAGETRNLEHVFLYL